ncbi:thioredoxin family protein [Leifsonia sp. L25]|uniref:thioredoxin family protein n=1 Tax=Actinomycetes TaxID=1760 RepID=UPI000EB5205B
MEITLQYFDGCPNWMTTEQRLHELTDGRADITIQRQLVSSVEEAETLGFHGSPTVLIDGDDPFAEPDAPVGLACRVYRSGAGFAGSPTLEQLNDVIESRHRSASR